MKKKIYLSYIFYNKVYIEFNKPIEVIITEFKRKENKFKLSCKQFDFIYLGDTESEQIDFLIFVIYTSYKCYAFESDDKLSHGAIQFKNKLNNNLKTLIK